MAAYCDLCGQWKVAVGVGIPGVLISPLYTPDGAKIVRRCEGCLRYPDDRAAAEALVGEKGGALKVVRMQDRDHQVWTPPGKA